jgi:hypothetical protein
LATDRSRCRALDGPLACQILDSLAKAERANMGQQRYGVATALDAAAAIPDLELCVDGEAIGPAAARTWAGEFACVDALEREAEALVSLNE